MLGEGLISCKLIESEPVWQDASLLSYRGLARIQLSHEQPDFYLRLCARKGVNWVSSELSQWMSNGSRRMVAPTSNRLQWVRWACRHQLFNRRCGR